MTKNDGTLYEWDVIIKLNTSICVSAYDDLEAENKAMRILRKRMINFEDFDFEIEYLNKGNAIEDDEE